MSSINNLGSVGGNWPVQNAGASKAPAQADPASAQTPTRAADRLDLSGVSHMLKTLKTNNVRADKVASIKSQIQAGKYEDDHKLNLATDRLLDDLLK